MALKSGYRWEEWLDLKIEARIDHVAFHRVRLLVDLNLDDAVVGEQERRAARQRMKRDGS